MTLDLSRDQIFMRDEARRLLAERAGSASLRKAIAAGGFDAALWETVGMELGWCAVAIPEDAGGLGLGALELMLLAEECGRRLAPLPFWSSACVVAPIIAALADEPSRGDLLARIATGEAAALALDFATCAVAVSAEKVDGGFRLSGTARHLLDAGSAAFLVIPANTADGGLGLFMLDQPAAERQVSPFDLTWPAADARLQGTLARCVATGFGLVDLTRALRSARLGLAALQIGSAQGALDITLAYIAERVQFGRTIASFQAIKHRCAGLVVDIAEARALLYGAAASYDGGSDDLDMEIAALGALAADVAFRAAEEAIQLHGGVGNTFEYDPHLYLRRAQATAHLFGSADEKLSGLADIIFGVAA